jgi:hypothetical protein
MSDVSDYMSYLQTMQYVSVFTELIVITGMILVGVGVFLIFRKQISFWHLLHIVVSFIGLVLLGLGVGLLAKQLLDGSLPDGPTLSGQQFVDQWTMIAVLIGVGGVVWGVFWTRLLRNFQLTEPVETKLEEETLRRETSAEQTRLIFKLHNFLLIWLGIVLMILASIMIARFTFYNIFRLIWDEAEKLEVASSLSTPLALLIVGIGYTWYHWRVMRQYKGFLPDTFAPHDRKNI